MISLPPPVRGRPPFILLLAFTSVPKTGVLVGAGAVGAGNVRVRWNCELL